MSNDMAISRAELEAYEKLYGDLVWIDRARMLDHPEGRAPLARMLEQYDAKLLGPYTEYEWGEIIGKLKAIRFALYGEENADS